jgi:tetratricopeptide (TPR) repeat protein
MKVSAGLVAVAIIVLQGCAAALVPYTSDPDKKLSYAYSLMNQGRIHPAERLGKESLNDFTELKDEFGMAESHVFLASLYKGTANATNPKFHVKFPDHDPKNGKVILHGTKAIELFIILNDFTQVSKTQFVLANFYLGQDLKEEGCNLYDESINNYNKGIALDPSTGFVISNPNFKNFPDMVEAFKLDHCSQENKT